jgi:hypothetical protein
MTRPDQPSQDLAWEIREYVRRCVLYGEPVQYRSSREGLKIVDAYGVHARELRAREQESAS